MPSITAAAQPTSSPPRIALTVSALTGSVAQLVRRDPDGTTSPVRAALTATGYGSQWTGYDYEAPYGAPVRYELESTTSAPVNLAARDLWLVHPLAPARSLRIARRDGYGAVVIESVGQRTRKVTSASLQPLGRSTPIVWTDGARRLPEFALTLRTDSADAELALLALLDDACPVLAAVPPAMRLGVAHGYVAVGDVTEAHPEDWGGSPERSWALPCTTVARPAGIVSLVSQWAYDDVVVAFDTYDDLVKAYATYADLAANVRQDVPAATTPAPELPGGPAAGGANDDVDPTPTTTPLPGTGTGTGTGTGAPPRPTPRTYDEVVAGYGTYDEVLEYYATYSDLAAGRERPLDVGPAEGAGDIPDYMPDYLDGDGG